MTLLIDSTHITSYCGYLKNQTQWIQIIAVVADPALVAYVALLVAVQARE